MEAYEQGYRLPPLVASILIQGSVEVREKKTVKEFDLMNVSAQDPRLDSYSKLKAITDMKWSLPTLKDLGLDQWWVQGEHGI